MQWEEGKKNSHFLSFPSTQDNANRRPHSHRPSWHGSAGVLAAVPASTRDSFGLNAVPTLENPSSSMSNAGQLPFHRGSAARTDLCLLPGKLERPPARSAPPGMLCCVWGVGNLPRDFNPVSIIMPPAFPVNSAHVKSGRRCPGLRVCSGRCSASPLVKDLPSSALRKCNACVLPRALVQLPHGTFSGGGTSSGHGSPCPGCKPFICTHTPGLASPSAPQLFPTPPRWSFSRPFFSLGTIETVPSTALWRPERNPSFGQVPTRTQSEAPPGGLPQSRTQAKRGICKITWKRSYYNINSKYEMYRVFTNCVLLPENNCHFNFVHIYVKHYLQNFDIIYYLIVYVHSCKYLCTTLSLVF